MYEQGCHNIFKGVTFCSKLFERDYVAVPT